MNYFFKVMELIKMRIEADEINIRPADERDLEKIFEIETRSFKKPWSKNLLLYSIRVGGMFVAEIDGEIRGYIAFSKILDEVHIENIAVEPEWRGKGIGSHLLKFVIEKNKDCDFFLEVRPSNQSAISLYKKFGFFEVGRRKKYYGDEDAIMMVRRKEIIRRTK
jgi:[ribosomal protein S18]-alanine N-acetyltransferase